MPKKVDHHERRTSLADALMRVAAHRGLEDVSLRHVAAEAGVTAGMVQHYFRTKDEMMTFALAAVRERVEQRLAADPPPDDATPREVVETLLVQLLPLDEQRELEAHVGLAFQAYAAVKPEIAAGLRDETAAMRDALAEQVGRARADRPDAPVGPDPDPDLAGTALLSLVEGLVLHVLGGHLSAAHAHAVLGAQLDLVLGRRAQTGPAARAPAPQ